MADENHKEKEELGVLEKIIKKLPTFHEAGKIAKILYKNSKNYDSYPNKIKVPFNKYTFNCIEDYLTNVENSSGVVIDIKESIELLKYKRILRTASDNKDEVILPLNFISLNPKVKSLRDVLEQSPESFSRSTGELAEVIYSTSEEYKENEAVALHDFVGKCVDNYWGETTGFFYEVVRAVKYLAEKEVIKADNGHFTLPLNFKEEK